jgi:hypothetical protein
MTGRSGRGTARQTIRVDEDRWNQFGETADTAGTDRSKILNEFIAYYNREPGAKPPKRPDAPATQPEG